MLLRKIFICTVSLVLLLLFSSCLLNKSYYRSFNEIYTFPLKDKINVEYRFVHEDDKYTWVYYSLFSDQLNYKKTDFDSLYTAAFKISYRLPEGYGNKKAGDTVFFMLFDHVKKVSTHLISGKVKLKIPQGFFSFLDLSFFDMNSGNRGFTSQFINKKDVYGAQNFFWITNKKQAAYRYYVNVGDTVWLMNNRVKQVGTIYTDFYKFSDQIALPPFSTSAELRTDKLSKQQNINQINGKFSLVTDKSGIYFCSIAENRESGIGLICVPAEFPELRSADDKLNCMRYIMTAEEFQEATDKNIKSDSLVFLWKKFAGSERRAIELMGEWYKRVSIANFYFTSFKEGWKTDRGMIFLVLGNPFRIEKSNEKEIWYYGDEKSLNSFSFEFDKINNPFTENDYQLQRGITLKNKWYNAVDVWRKGRIYNGN